MVGTSKFCIKDRLPGAGSCGTGKHEISKFPAKQDAFYLKHNEIQAYCQPVIEATMFNEEQKYVLTQKRLTGSEWRDTFGELDRGAILDWLVIGSKDTTSGVMDAPLEQRKMSALKTLGILSPTKGDAVIFDFQPSLSFDSSDSNVLCILPEGDADWREAVSPSELLHYVDSIEKKSEKD